MYELRLFTSKTYSNFVKTDQFLCNLQHKHSDKQTDILNYQPYQWPSGSAIKTGRQDVSGSTQLLSTQQFGVFRGFLRNLCKCGLRSLKKTSSTQDTPLPHRRQSQMQTIGLGATKLKKKMKIGVLVQKLCLNIHLKKSLNCIIFLLSMSVKKCSIMEQKQANNEKKRTWNIT